MDQLDNDRQQEAVIEQQHIVMQELLDLDMEHEDNAIQDANDFPDENNLSSENLSAISASVNSRVMRGPAEKNKRSKKCNEINIKYLL